jgi:hypothetical protein
LLLLEISLMYSILMVALISLWREYPVIIGFNCLMEALLTIAIILAPIIYWSRVQTLIL